MKYREFGKTGAMVSQLGFGCMRLPMIGEGNSAHVDEEKAIPLLRKGFEMGINYFDTAPYYCNKESEIAVGKALKPFRDKVYISTKNPIEDATGKGYRERLERSLKNLDVDYIDFYHMWGINWKAYEEKINVKDGPLYEAFKAKEEGLIKHMSFSFHDSPENLIKLIDTGNFETMLVQYNLLDRKNEEGIAHAHEKGMGVVIMGPVAGGRLACPSEMIQNMIPGKVYSSYELALKFVLSNPNVTIALSGMGNMDMLEQNAKIAEEDIHLTQEEINNVKLVMEEKRKLSDLYCTGCKYCMPCPKGVNIPRVFELMNYYRMYEIKDYARNEYAKLDGSQEKGFKADSCVECGLCEKKCPQHIKIREQLKESHKVLA